MMSSRGPGRSAILSGSFGLSVFAALLGVGLAGCGDKGTHRDEQASLAFRAAWNKRRAGDEAGYRSGMAELAKRRDTWAGERAALDLELVDETDGDSLLSRLLHQAAGAVGDPSKLPAGLSGLKAPAADPEEAPARLAPPDPEP